jgi:nucleotide-binding universal stress UspA family protein
MIKTLVSLDADLASSIALRYACRLAGLVAMQLQTIHVEEAEKEGYPPGSGWVRSTWEKSLIQTAQAEISQLINTEKSTCPPLGASLVVIGDREEELLREIENAAPDLLIEGVLSSFEAQLFFKKVRSKLYKQAPCPIVLVKNLVDPGRVALLVSDAKDAASLVSTFATLFGRSKLSVDLVYFSTKTTDHHLLKQKMSDAPLPGLEQASQVIEEAKALLAEHGQAPAACWAVRGPSRQIGEALDEYGLVSARIPRSGNRKNIIMDLLSRVPSATLFCK